MEITDYDQYVPERELNTNFRIPRKRTAEESFGRGDNRMQAFSNYNLNEINRPGHGNNAFGFSYNERPRPFYPGCTPTIQQRVSPGNNRMEMIESPKRLMISNDNPRISQEGPLWLGDRRNSSIFIQNNDNFEIPNYSRRNRDSFLWERRQDFRETSEQFEKPSGGNNDFSTVTQGNSETNFKSYDRQWKSGNKLTEDRKNFKRYWNKSEKPENSKTNTPPPAIPDKLDDSLPKELREMFEPLFCKLCSLQMTSNVMAKMHYVSKNHEKKIRKYLIEYAEKTGSPLHPRATATTAEKKEKKEDKDPRNFYCEICDLQLTGKQHADSHYMGKSHNAVLMGKKKPSGKGYFDHNGKWIRTIKEEKQLMGDGEDNFGTDFRKKPDDVDATIIKEDPKGQGKVKEQFVCSLCTVSCISQEQLDIHLGGSKHKKKLKLKGLCPENFILTAENDQKDGDIDGTTATGNTSPNHEDSLKRNYITPNGYYYCEKCNLSVNSESQFKQHLGSKNHAKKVNAQKPVDGFQLE